MAGGCDSPSGCEVSGDLSLSAVMARRGGTRRGRGETGTGGEDGGDGEGNEKGKECD